MDDPLLLIGMTFVVCLASGLIPVVNAEIYLLSVSIAASPSLGVALATAAALGQMTAKTGLYYAAARGGELPKGRMRARLDALRLRVERQSGIAGTLLFVSALFGIPPFYVLTLVAGLCRVSLARFIAIGTIGRGLRFYACIAAPSVVLDLLQLARGAP